MSLFDEFEVAANVFLPNDNNTTKITSWNYGTPDFTVNINIIQLSPEEQVFFQQELADYKANVDSADASQMVKGCRIDDGTYKFEVTNEPVARKLFPGFHTVRLRRLNQ